MLGMLVQCTNNLYAVLTVEALCVLSCSTKNRHLRFHNSKNHQTCDFLQDTKNDNFSAVCKPGHKCALAHPYFHIHLFEGIQFGY